MALRLKDISNLPPNLPVSQIPQQVSTSPCFTKLCQDHWAQQRTSLEAANQPEFHPQQQRDAVFSQDGLACDVDDSLTDMQWLQRMDAGSDFPGLARNYKRIGGKGSRGGGRDSCRKKLEYSNSKKDNNKPPLSYASLIALAICSTPQRMMTLSSIYRWIEYTFPFYRTPEAKAWKNSIRHNLSIRKNMFMKVYQYPPRRGNGSYWTLLSDGEEELKKAVPLFTTLQPPVIDTNSVYHHREPSVHVVKPQGKFVPLLPRSDTTENQSYFSLGSSLSSDMKIFSSVHSVGPSIEVEVEDDINENAEHFMSAMDCKRMPDGTLHMSAVQLPLSMPIHLHDHNYAKDQSLQEVDELMDRSVDDEVVELATGVWDQGTSKDADSFTSRTPKRKRKLPMSYRGRQYSLNSTADRTSLKQPCVGGVFCTLEDSPSFTTPTKEQDTSLHLLDSSVLTPIKSLMDAEGNTMSFSPLYTDHATPKRGKITGQLLTSDAQPISYFHSPFTPLKGSYDSGIFSPLHTDPLGGIKFGTPTNMSPLRDLNAFGLQPEMCPLKVLDSSVGMGSTPLRPGSLHAFGLPGLTPPSRK